VWILGSGSIHLRPFNDITFFVAPVFKGQNERKVSLPEGNWYDFYTGDYVWNGETITIKTQLKEIPLFVKDGAIIPMLSSNESTVHLNAGALEVRHYGTKEAKYLLYNDDGESFDYEKGEFSLTELLVQRKKNGELTGKITPLNKSNFSFGEISWRWMTK
jgi:alpha-glucosidase (family GH31 glycosyl hydrolase)